MLGRLLDATPTSPQEADLSAVQDTLSVAVGPHQVVLRRTAPFTATEHARAVAFAEVASELLDAHTGPYDDEAGPSRRRRRPRRAPTVRLADVRRHRVAGPDARPLLGRLGLPPLRHAAGPDRRPVRPAAAAAGNGALVATVGDEVVGIASISTCENAIAEVSLLVEDGWQRRGLGTRLLSGAARLARGHGAAEVVLRSRTHNPALMSLAFASGLRARIRLDGDTVVVTVGVDGLKPLTMVPAATARRHHPRASRRLPDRAATVARSSRVPGFRPRALGVVRPGQPVGVTADTSSGPCRPATRVPRLGPPPPAPRRASWTSTPPASPTSSPRSA